jgi:hypothetical protein
VQLEDTGTKMINAFASGVAINAKRQQVEAQLQKLALAQERMNLQDGWKERDFNYKMQEAGVKDEYNQAKLGISYDHLNLAQDRLGYEKEKADDMFNIATLKQAKDAEYSKANSSMIQDFADNPYPAGTTQAKAWVEDKKNDYSDWLDNTHVGSTLNAERRRQTQEATRLHRDASDAMNFFQKDRNLTIGTTPTDKMIAEQPEAMWGIDRKKGTRWVAYNAQGPVDPSVASGKGQEELAKMKIFKKEIPSDDYDRLRKGAENLKRYLPGGELFPAPVDGAITKPMTPDVAKDFIQQAGGNKDKARELARQAGYTF